MTTDSTTTVDDGTLFLGEAWPDPIEAGIRDRIRGLIEELIEEEPAAALGRGRYQCRPRRGGDEAGPGDGPPAAGQAGVTPLAGHRHGHRQRQMTGCFGAVETAVPRARIDTAGGGTAEWKSRVLPRYARMTRQVEALIAGDNWQLDGNTITVFIPMTWKRRGGRKVIVAPDGGDAWAPAKPRPDETLIRALARAHRWKRMLEERRYRSAGELAEAEGVTRSFVNRLLWLALLAPDIVEAILDGRQPKGMQLEELTRTLPSGWEGQRQFFSADPSPSK